MRDVAVLHFTKGGKVNSIEYWKTPSELKSYHVRNLVLMQSTGLRDKNGVEIFEGDILVYDAPKKYAHRRSMHEIAYADGRFFWEFLDLVFCQSNILYRDGYLVIGNIHENPELLEVK
ncbi:YopX family protein [Enterococcus faecalis]|nr:DNA-packaging protein [Enterococcus faecalis]TQA50106.1 DNA-packaging protein [Enterococcus faecalis]TQA73639.1 DNA-packaging protein [Enterococcus faecalis]TQB16487.1 DNA-packaging protein [Enterococcus faecalis]